MKKIFLCAFLDVIWTYLNKHSPPPPDKKEKKRKKTRINFIYISYKAKFKKMGKGYSKYFTYFLTFLVVRK